MHLTRHLKQTTDTIHDGVQQLADKATKFKNAATLAVLLALSTGAADEARTQTTYVDTIPQNVHSTVYVSVQQDLLDVLELTAEEFTEQIVEPDLDVVNEALYYSTKTNQIDQEVFIMLNDQIRVIPNDELPPSGSSTGTVTNAIAVDDDGYVDRYEDELTCQEAAGALLYGNFSGKGTAILGGPYITMNGTLNDLGRQKTIIHERGHRGGGTHLGYGNDPKRRPGEIEVVTPRLEEYAAKEGYDPELYIGHPTTLGFSGRVDFYSHPELHPSLEANVAELMETKIKETRADHPLLTTGIVTPSDSLQVGTMSHFEADLNRDDLDDYTFSWTVSQDGQVVHTDEGETLNYMPQDTGMLTIELFAQKACGGQADTKTMSLPVIDDATSVDEAERQVFANMKLAPNPTTGQVELLQVAPSKIDRVDLFSPRGLHLFSSDETTINLERQPPGVYLLRIVGQHGTVITTQVIKQ